MKILTENQIIVSNDMTIYLWTNPKKQNDEKIIFKSLSLEVGYELLSSNNSDFIERVFLEIKLQVKNKVELIDLPRICEMFESICDVERK